MIRHVTFGYLISWWALVTIRRRQYLFASNISLLVMSFLRQHNREDGVRSTTGLVHISCSYCPVNDTRHTGTVSFVTLLLSRHHLVIIIIIILRRLTSAARAGNNRFESIRWTNRFEWIRYGESEANGVRFGRGHVVLSHSPGSALHSIELFRSWNKIKKDA